MFKMNSIVYFYSLSFILFAMTTVVLYWTLPQRWRNFVLLLASYTFYCSWDYRFLGLLFASTAIDYLSARFIEDMPKHRRQFLWLSVASNLGILFFFKYFNFFQDGLVDFAGLFGFHPGKTELNIVLPLGISFYIFQSMSYVIDVYRKKLKAHRDFFEFALFVSYFPQLIAGPIERANYLLPQFISEKKWREIPFAEAFYLFAWGFFKKRAIADFLSLAIANGYAAHPKPGLMTLLGMIAYVFKLYADISGYADMARGVSLLFGIRLSSNFFFPYFSKNPVDYWKRWHITLSVWARHYVFTPLLTKLRNPILVIVLTFMVMGIWHGPKWHYIHWGLYWAFWSIAFQYLNKWGVWRNWFMLAIIFVGQAFFNAESIPHFLNLLSGLGHDVLNVGFLNAYYYKVIFVLFLFLIYETILCRKEDEVYLVKKSFYSQCLFYFGLLFIYRNFGEIAAVDFIYFSF